MSRRKPPAHLEGITGAELRRREEPRREVIRGNAMAVHEVPRIHGPTKADFEGQPPATDLCVRCGSGVLWTPQTGPLDRDGTEHRQTCDDIVDERGTMTTPGTSAVAAPSFTVSVGPRNAYTDPDSGLRFYRWQGRDLPSVTSIRRMAGVPHPLHQWILTQVINHTLNNWRPLSERLAKGDPGELALIRSEMRTAATAERDLAGKLGTAVHDAAAAGKRLTEVQPEVAPRLAQYLDWLAVSGVTVLGAEFQVFNLTVGYAGTVDLLVRFPNGAVWLIDLKTGKSVVSDYVTQLVGYRFAEFVGADDTVDEPMTALLREIAGVAILHLADDHWEFIRTPDDESVWNAFRGLLEFAMWSHNHQKPETFTLAARRSVAAA